MVPFGKQQEILRDLWTLKKHRQGLRPVSFNPCSAPALPVQTWGTRLGPVQREGSDRIWNSVSLGPLQKPGVRRNRGIQKCDVMAIARGNGETGKISQGAKSTRPIDIK
jgi:hypothetical protein